MDLRNPRHWLVAALICGIASTILLLRARCPIYFDESISLLEVAGNAAPAWPEHSESASTIVMDFLERRAPLAEVVLGVIQTDVHPPLYYAALWVWRLVFGPSLFAARGLSILFTLATVCILLVVGRGLRFWWLAGLVFALSGAAFRYGPWARNYAMARFLVTAMTGLALAHGSRLTSALIGIVGALAFATHYFALFPVAGILTIFIWSEWPRQKVRALIPLGIFVLFSLPSAPALLHAAGLRPGQYAGFKGWLLESAYAFRGLCLQLISQPHKLGLWPGRVAIVLAGALIVGAFLWILSRKQSSSAARFCVAAVGAQYFGVLGLFAATNKTLVTNDSAARYLGIVSPLIALILAGWLSGVQDLHLKRVAVLILSGLLGIEVARRDLCYETLGMPPGLVRSGTTAVVGEGFDRGVPAVIALQVPPDARICVIRHESSCPIEATKAPLVFRSQPDSPTYAAEEAFLSRCPQCRTVGSEFGMK